MVYNAQHEQLIEEMAPTFTEETGIEVELRNGSDLELAAQLIEEGDASPADVFLTENSPAMSQVEREGLFAALDEATLTPIPAQYRPEPAGLWTGFVARSTVLVYNTDLVDESELPDSIMDLAEPEWAGTDLLLADRRRLPGHRRARCSTSRARTRPGPGSRASRPTAPSTTATTSCSSRSTPASPRIGIIYHYYWYRDQAESGEISDNTALYFFGNQDPGAFVSVSGAGVLKSSDHQSDAEKFVEYLTSEDGQQGLADSYALEYPLNPAVSLGPARSSRSPSSSPRSSTSPTWTARPSST